MYRDARGQIIKDGSLECEDLSSDDRVGQGETDKEGLENREASVGGHTEAHRGHTESSSCPLSDGVGDGLLHLHRAVVSVRGQLEGRLRPGGRVFDSPLLSTSA